MYHISEKKSFYHMSKICIKAIGQSRCEFMREADLRNAHHSLRFASLSQMYFGITTFYGLLTSYYTGLGVGFSASPGIDKNS